MIKIPRKLIERALKEKAKRVSKKAVFLLIEKLKKELGIISDLAVRNAKHHGRKLITEEDIEFAFSLSSSASQ